MENFTRRDFLQNTLAASLAAGLLPRAAAEEGTQGPERPPNIIVFLTDDQHFEAMGCMGNSIIHTPEMDALAENGVLFENAFVTTPICCTSRASILTGTYGWSNGAHEFYADLPPDLLGITYPLALRRNGYRTAFVGKYGVGRNHPRDEYDYWVDLPGNHYFHEVDGQRRHMTSMLADASIEFLTSCTPDRPFCLSLSTFAPHAHDYAERPFPPDPAFEHLYEDVEIPKPELADEKYYEALPPFLRTGESEGRIRWKNRYNTPERYQESVRDYYRLITGVDYALGRIRRTLAHQGLADNTVIIFLSDNGFFLGHRGLADKWYAYEDSIRIPFIIYDPRLPEAQRGRRIGDMALNIDVAPTVLDLAGVDIPDEIQGESLVPFMLGESPEWREHWFFEHRFEHPGIPKSEGVRTTRWKYFRWLETEPELEELYDLDNDPLETNNLAEDPEHVDVLAEMRALTDHYRETLPHRPTPPRP